MTAAMPEVRRTAVIDLTMPITRANWPDLYGRTREFDGAWVEVVLSEENAIKFELPRTIAMACFTAARITIRGGGRHARYFEADLRRDLQQVVAEHNRFLDELARNENRTI